MKHNIRQKILDPVRGLVTKVITIDGELCGVVPCDHILQASRRVNEIADRIKEVELK